MAIIFRPLWLQKLMVWLWHRLTFKRTRELLKAIMTDRYETYTAGRVSWVIGNLVFLVLSVWTVTIQGKDFDPMAYSGGLTAILIAGATNVWLDAKATKTEAEAPSGASTPEAP